MHTLLGFGCGILVGTVGGALLVDWWASRKIAEFSGRYLAVSPQSGVDVAEMLAAIERRARRSAGWYL